LTPNVNLNLSIINTMDLEILGGFLKKVGNFSMKSYEKRLIFQKTVYFLQEFGVGFGYKFSWYIAGPYSPELAGDGFRLEAIYDKARRVEMIEKKDQDSINSFLVFIEGIKNNARQLELLASIDFLKKLGYSEDSMRTIVKAKVQLFTDEEIDRGLRTLAERGPS